jgi:hypothetical protein
LDSENKNVLFEWLTRYLPVCQVQSSLFRRDKGVSERLRRGKRKRREHPQKITSQGKE